MKQLIIYSLAASAMLALASCHTKHNEPARPISNEKVAIIPTIQLSDYSRAATSLQTTTFDSDTKVGFFVTDEDSKELHSNVKHSIVNGAFKTEGEVMYWPTSNKNINIYAYAPYDESRNSLTDAISFSVQTDQSVKAKYLSSDLIYGIPASNPVTNTAYTSGSQSRVPMIFSHKLSKVTLKFTANATTVKVVNGTATINAVTSCNFKLSDGKLGDASSTATDITVAHDANIDGSVTASKTYTCSAIIVPQTIAQGTIFITLEDDNASFTVKMSNDVTFESGKEYVFNIGLDPEKVEIETGEITLNNWGTTTEIDETAERDKVIKVGYYLMSDGSYVNSPTAKPDNAIGMVISTTDIPFGYNAMVMSVLPALSYSKFGSGDTGSYISSVDDIESSTTSGLDMIETFESKLSLFTAYQNLYNKLWSTHINATKWFIPSVTEMMKIAEFFSSDTDTWTINGATYQRGYTVIPEVYTPILATTSNIFESSFTARDYWTSTMSDAGNVWICHMGSKNDNIKIEKLDKNTNPVYTIPILYSK